MDPIIRQVYDSQFRQMLDLDQITCDHTVVLQVNSDQILAWPEVFKDFLKAVALEHEYSH